MSHRIRRFLPLLWSLLFALNLLGCVSQALDASTQWSQRTLQSLHQRNPKALATRVCVLPDEVPAGTKFLLADARRSTFVSDQNRQAFERFLPFADTIFEFDLFARASSAALLGAALNLSCPETFTVLRSPEDVEDGESRMQTVTRIPTSAHRELRSIVEQTCQAAAHEGTDRRYIGQETRQKKHIVLGVPTPPEQARILRLLGIEKIPEPEPSGPKSVVRQLMDTPEGQTFGGVASGVPIALVGGGTIAADLAIEAGLLPKGTREARIGKACAELGVGAVQVVVGCGGMGVGAGTSGTGVGAPAGALVFLGSLGLTTTGLVNCGNGIRHLAIELWGADDGEVLPASGSYAQTGPSAPTPQATSATTPKGVAKPAETTPKAAVPETKATTRGKGKQSASAEPTPAVKGAKRGPKTDPDAPHNAAIRREADKLKAQGNTILNGGGEYTEEVVEINGGLKAHRRPDITYRTPTGEIRGRNVGKTNADGTPVKREAEALKDLNDHSDRHTDFVPY